jgi:FkbM family methyltransferase
MIKKIKNILFWAFVWFMSVFGIFSVIFCREKIDEDTYTCTGKYETVQIFLWFCIFLTAVPLVIVDKVNKKRKWADNELVSCTRDMNVNNKTKSTIKINWIDISEIKDSFSDLFWGRDSNIQEDECTELIKTKYWFPMFKIKDNYITQYECDRESIFWYSIACDIINHKINPGDSFVDIWGRDGLHSMVAMNKIWDKWKIIIFEPYENDYEILEKNMKLNPVWNVVLRKDWPGLENDKRWYLHMHNRLNSNRNVFSISEWFGSFVQVKIDSLDNILASEWKINFIKINTPHLDIWFILSGMKNILTKHHPKLLFQLDTSIIWWNVNTALETIFNNWYNIFYLSNDMEDQSKFSFHQVYNIDDIPDWEILLYCE